MSSSKLLAVAAMGCCAFLAACSAPGRNFSDSRLRETLEVEILPNTSKMFIYRLQMPEDLIPSQVRIERGGWSRGDDEPAGIALGASTPKRLQENAAFVVAQMGYCREGVLIIDSSASRFNLWVKGECKEGATDLDRQTFGGKKILPVTLAH